jgi:acetyl-CoA C-acetyltransferase
MEDVVIVDAVRTAIGKFGGTLAGIPAHTLGSRVIAALLERTGMDAARVDEVIMGQVLTAGTGQPARRLSLPACRSTFRP